MLTSWLTSKTLKRRLRTCGMMGLDLVSSRTTEEGGLEAIGRSEDTTVGR